MTTKGQRRSTRRRIERRRLNAAEDPSPKVAHSYGDKVVVATTPSKFDPSSHSPQCSYHAEQYPWECDCGVIEQEPRQP